jgi:hypothetical protein
MRYKKNQKYDIPLISLSTLPAYPQGSQPYLLLMQLLAVQHIAAQIAPVQDLLLYRSRLDPIQRLQNRQVCDKGEALEAKISLAIYDTRFAYCEHTHGDSINLRGIGK